MFNHRWLVVLVTGTLCVAAGCAGTAPQATAAFHSPAETFERMDRVTIQIVRGTAHMSDLDYQTRVRPGLASRLAALGFDQVQADQILARVDEARADRANVRRWWARVSGAEDGTAVAGAR